MKYAEPLAVPYPRDRDTLALPLGRSIDVWSVPFNFACERPWPKAWKALTYGHSQDCTTPPIASIHARAALDGARRGGALSSPMFCIGPDESESDDRTMLRMVFWRVEAEAEGLLLRREFDRKARWLQNHEANQQLEEDPNVAGH